MAVVKTLQESAQHPRSRGVHLHSLDSRQTFTLKVTSLGFTRRNSLSGIDELLKRDVSVTLLTVKVTILIRRVFDIKRVVLSR